MASEVGPDPKIVCAARYEVFQCWYSSWKKSGTPLMCIFQVQYSRLSLIFVRCPTVGEKCWEKRIGPSKEYRGGDCPAASSDGVVEILETVGGEIKSFPDNVTHFHPECTFDFLENRRHDFYLLRALRYCCFETSNIIIVD